MLVYFVTGTLLLPEGDFATLQDLPKMYAHCKASEDHDLTIPDFIEEHLLMLDDLMGEKPEPEDKPHQPLQFHHIYVPVCLALRNTFKVAELPVFNEVSRPVYRDESYLADYAGAVFRPPIA